MSRLSLFKSTLEKLENIITYNQPGNSIADRMWLFCKVAEKPGKFTLKLSSQKPVDLPVVDLDNF